MNNKNQLGQLGSGYLSILYQNHSVVVRSLLKTDYYTSIIAGNWYLDILVQQPNRKLDLKWDSGVYTMF